MTAPTAPSPGLGEREAVARTISGVIRNRGPRSGFIADAIIAEHIAPLRTENETLRDDLATEEARARDNAAVASRWRKRAFIAEAERDAAIARAEEAERKVGDLSATITAWEGAFGTIRSHLQDRIAMNDPARPDTYLRIVEGSVGELPRISRQIYAATQYRSQSTQAYANRVDLENETLTAKLAQAEGEIATMRAALEPFASFGRHWVNTEGWISTIHREAISTWFGPSEFRAAAALTNPEPPHGD